MAGQRAAIGKYLAFSRVQEALGRRRRRALPQHRRRSPARGMLSFFKKLTAQMHRYG